MELPLNNDSFIAISTLFAVFIIVSFMVIVVEQALATFKGATDA
jgi:uncharacterized membrane protein